MSFWKAYALGTVCGWPLIWAASYFGWRRVAGWAIAAILGSAFWYGFFELAFWRMGW